VCLFDGADPVSNVVTLSARWESAEEDVWYFDIARMPWNVLALKSKRKRTVLVVEFNVIVEPEVRLTDAQIMSDKKTPKAKSTEITCGHACWEIVKADLFGLDKVVELTVPMYGGTYVDRLLLKPEEVLARRTGM
jgi:hypothetical protein